MPSHCHSGPAVIPAKAGIHRRRRYCRPIVIPALPSFPRRRESIAAAIAVPPSFLPCRHSRESGNPSPPPPLPAHCHSAPTVIPAKAGIHYSPQVPFPGKPEPIASISTGLGLLAKFLDSRFRGNDGGAGMTLHRRNDVVTGYDGGVGTTPPGGNDGGAGMMRPAGMMVGRV